jgi:lipoprotein-releasing system ATP-binding protein
MSNNIVLELKNITRSFTQGGETVHVLRGIDLSIKRGEVVALVGESGSGKSTMLQIAGLLDTPTGGDIVIAGVNASKANDAERTRLRLQHLGFVYQFHHLLPEFTACENIAIPLMIAGESYAKATARGKELLATLGLKDRATHRPAALSGGEQQRVAIARALVGNPSLILADEPTGNLDPATSETVFSLFMSLAKSQGLSALVATHNLNLAHRMDRVVTLNKGKV